MERKVILIDAGHGGLENGIYTTPGKRSPCWDDCPQYFEGVGNREIRNLLAEMLREASVPFHFVSTGSKDVTLDKRVAVINAWCAAYGADSCLLVSIHSNGHSNENAHGWEVFTTKGTTQSDQYASVLFEEMKTLFPERAFRVDKRDGDVDKESNFFIIAHSLCPAILSENWFHTNKDECQNILMDSEGQHKIALGHFNMIQKTIGL